MTTQEVMVAVISPTDEEEIIVIVKKLILLFFLLLSSPDWLANINPLQYVIYQKCELSCHTEFLVSKIKLKCCTVCFCI